MSSPFVAGCTAVLLNAMKENGMKLENKELFSSFLFYMFSYMRVRG